MSMSTTLPDHEHKKIFERLIVPNALRGTNPVRERPKAIIIAGAPGSGKGGLTAAARKDFAGDPAGHVEIDVDELRWYHREYEPLLRTDDRTAATAVHVDATAWGEGLRVHCIEERRNMIIDGTLKSPDKALAMAQELREAGYETEVRVIGVPKQVSVQGVYRRYERARAEGRPGRWVPERVVDEAHMGVPGSIAALHERGAVDAITIYHRSPKHPVDNRGRLAVRAVSTTIYENGRAPDPPPPHEALQAVRTRPLRPDEQTAYRIECRRICKAIAQRDADLSEPENLRAFELAHQHGTRVEHPRLKPRTPAASATIPDENRFRNFVPPKAKGTGARARQRARESEQTRALKPDRHEGPLG